MNKSHVHYRFPQGTNHRKLGAALELAFAATECLHGLAQTAIDGDLYFEPAERCCKLPTDTPVGRDLNRLFVGLLASQYGISGFYIKRVDHPDREEGEDAA